MYNSYNVIAVFVHCFDEKVSFVPLRFIIVKENISGAAGDCSTELLEIA